MNRIELAENAGIILARPDRLGDVIASSALITPLREKFPTARLYFLAREEFRGLFHQHPQLAGFVGLPKKAEEPEALLPLLTPLKASVLILLNPHGELLTAAQDAGITHRIGWLEHPSARLTHAIPDTRARGLRHEALACADLLLPLGIKSVQNLRTNLSIEPASPTDDPLPGSLVIHPYASKAQKAWPLGNWVAVAKSCINKGVKVVLVGDPNAFPGKEKIDLAFQGLEVTRMDGKLSLAALARLLAGAKFFISADSGPAHLAAAVNCPTLVLFGRTDSELGPERWTPLGSGVQILTPTARRLPLEPTSWFWSRSFRSIKPEAVWGKISAVFPTS